jgi:hypothetical protein
MPDRDDNYRSNVPQAWSGGNVPVVVVAPPASEPSVTRGVTGLFVPIFLAAFIVLAIYFFFGAWQAAEALSEQKAITRDATGLYDYRENLEQQNAALCADWRLAAPERIERPNIIAQLDDMRREYDTQCARNRRYSGGTCTTQMAAPRLRLPEGETLDQFRTRLCRPYPPPRRTTR